MKTYIPLLLSAIFFCHNSDGEVLQESKIAQVVSSAIPSYDLVGGDSGWSGGVKGNADMDNQTFDSNTAFFIFELRLGQKVLPAKDIVETIKGYLVRKFNFPTVSPSSTWMKQQPAGTTDQTFAELFLRTYPQNNDVKAQSMYLTIQAIRFNDSRFAVTVTYVDRER